MWTADSLFFFVILLSIFVTKLHTQFKKAKIRSCCKSILVLAELQCGRQCTDAAKQDLEDLNTTWCPWCCCWNPNTLATWCKELTHWKRLWCWGRLKVGGAGDDRRWDGWMASPTWWTWVWVASRSWWWTGKPGVLQSMGSQRVGHNWATELSWCPLGFPGGSVVKNPACMRCSFDPWVRKIPWRRKWQPTLVFLPGKSHGQRILAGYSPCGQKEVDTT